MAFEWIAAVSGIAGALGAVLVQGLLNHVGGDAQRKRELLLQAYQALIDATASLAANDDHEANLKSLIAAKQRILYFAPDEVVQALAAFFRTSQMFVNSDAVAAFADLLKAMRKSLDLPPIEERDLLRVLIGYDQLLADPSQ